jgi:hypothetical protein
MGEILLWKGLFFGSSSQEYRVIRRPEASLSSNNLSDPWGLLVLDFIRLALIGLWCRYRVMLISWWTNYNVIPRKS